MRITTAGLLLAALIATAACSSKAATSASDTTAPDDAAASPAPSASAVTITTKDGTVSNSVDTSKLGAPVYPGATADAQSGISADTPQGSSNIGVFKTTDPFDKVYDYYKSQMPAGSETMKMSAAGASTATWRVGKDGDADQVAVQVNADQSGKVSILISHIVKNDASPAPAST